MEKISIKDLRTKSCKRCFQNKMKHGWSDAYYNVPGKQSYEDGFYSGFIDGYDEAVKDIKLRLKVIAVENQEMNERELERMGVKLNTPREEINTNLPFVLDKVEYSYEDVLALFNS